MTSPVYEPFGTAGTASDLALLRRLLVDTVEPYRQLDSELTALIATGRKVPQVWDPQLGVYVPAVPGPDLYGLAADLWELRALDLDGLPAEPVRVTSERNGDLAVTYAGPGKTVGPAALTAERMRAIARQLRRKSPNAGARTVVVESQFARRELPVRGGLYSQQLVN